MEAWPPADFINCSTKAIAPSSSMKVELKLISSIRSMMPRAVLGTLGRSIGLMPTTIRSVAFVPR